jgi:hypothetical protein
VIAPRTRLASVASSSGIAPQIDAATGIRDLWGQILYFNIDKDVPMVIGSARDVEMQDLTPGPRRSSTMAPN